MKINVSLSKESIEQAIKTLNQYETELEEKCQRAVEMLAEVGIETAKSTTSNLGSYITFAQRIEQTDKSNVVAIMYAYDRQKVRSQWLRYGNVEEAEISPLLMEEFGSGFEAVNPWNLPGVGQGTFPGQKHAFDEGGWYYMDLEGNWHHTKGREPTMPMYSARVRMAIAINRILKEAFNG